MTTELQHEIRSTEYSIEECKFKIALYEKLQKLSKNKEFKELIMDGWLKDECMNATALLANPASQDGAMEILKGMARLRQHLSSINAAGHQAKFSDLAGYEATLRQLRIEAMSPEVDGE